MHIQFEVDIVGSLAFILPPLPYLNGEEFNTLKIQIKIFSTLIFNFLLLLLLFFLMKPHHTNKYDLK